eukprot:1087374-Prorocentrum_minimum.AAC.4
MALARSFQTQLSTRPRTRNAVDTPLPTLSATRHLRSEPTIARTFTPSQSLPGSPHNIIRDYASSLLQNGNCRSLPLVPATSACLTACMYVFSKASFYYVIAGFPNHFSSVHGHTTTWYGHAGHTQAVNLASLNGQCSKT